MQTPLTDWFYLFGAGLLACTANVPSPTAPTSPAPTVVSTAEPPAVPSVAREPTPQAAAPESAPAPPSAPAPEAQPEAVAEEKPSRSPVAILTSPDTAFLINYSSSAPREAAEKACAARGGADDDALGKCMTEARLAFKADVLRFKPEGGHWSCTIYKRDGSRLDEVYSARVLLSDDSPNSVKLKFTGAEKGMRPLLRSKREIVLQVPNDYSFVLNDPERGRLVYEAKIGLIGS